jgi:aryl-alcohol dehydrogenase-like predicted oxidoreductase
MALAPWNVLASGKFRTDKEEQRRRESGEKGREFMSGSWERTEDEKKISQALEKVAKEVGASSITAGTFGSAMITMFMLMMANTVAIAYLMQKTPYVFPLVGGRKVEHLYGNLEALDISLSPEHMKYLESVIPFDPGFPTTMIVGSSDFGHISN